MEPARKLEFNARYAMTCEDGAYRFQFYCAICEGSSITNLICTDTIEAALQIARAEARRHFNGCHGCGRWVCDRHYNMDEMMCSECAPLKK